MIKTLFWIQPFNEGQELNYSERHFGTIFSARNRALNMFEHLTKALKDATLLVEIQDSEGRSIEHIGGDE